MFICILAVRTVRTTVTTYVPPYVPVIVPTEVDLFQRLQEGAQAWVLPLQRLALGTLALLEQAAGQDAKLLAVDQSLPVRVGRGGDEQGVNLQERMNPPWL